MGINMNFLNILKKNLTKIYVLQFNEYKLFLRKPTRSEDIIYVIRFFRKEGLMSILYKACEHLEYVEMQGYTPYVDMKHFPTIYRCDGNAWESFFEQPVEQEQQNIKKKRYILAWTSRPPKTKWYEVYWAEAFCNYKEKNRIFHNYIRIKPDILEIVDEIGKKIQIENCIGLLIRGTDYAALKPKGHPIQPELLDVMSKLDEFIEKYQAKCFLVTEDKEIRSRILDKYGNQIVTIPNDITIDDYQKGKMLGDSIQKENSIAIGKCYLEKIVLLSRCKYLIASKTNGSLMALIMNNETYEDCWVFDCGMYE